MNQETPAAPTNSAAGVRAAEEVFGHFCNVPVMPSKDRIPALAAIIDQETRLPALIAAVDKALAAWYGDRAPGEDPIYRQADAMRELRAMREQMKMRL